MKNKIISTLVLIVIIIAGVVGYKYYVSSKEVANNDNVETKIDEKTKDEDDSLVVTIQKPKIFTGNDRPIAVMIDNHSGAWPQANLNKAYIVYEIIVEGGETRLMAVFKGQELEKIGPLRSSRHYFLDYALENDAIYVHHGWSPQAQNDIKELGVNNINGIQESSKDFWRVKDKTAPHNLFTSTESILKIAKQKGYSTESSKKSVLNYTTNEVQLNSKYGIEKNESVDSTEVGEETSDQNSNNKMAISASTVNIPHSSLQKVEYVYNSETKRYTRYARGKLQTDYITGEEVTTKNIIITKCDNYTLQDSEEKGRQGLKNIGTFDGYYITNGYAIPIKCIKNSRTEQTQYVDLNGNVIEVNDGNTFINICPTDAKIVIE